MIQKLSFPKILIAGLLYIVGTFSIYADDESKDENARETGRLWGFVGVDGGYFRFNTDIKTLDGNGAPEELSSNGYQFNGKGLLSYYTYHFVFDGGLGYLYNRTSASKGFTVPAGYPAAGQTTTESQHITTKTTFGEAGARFRFSDRWSLGAIYTIAFGTDANFGAKRSKHNVTNFIGPQLMYEMPVFTDWRLRLHLSGLTDLTIDNRTTYLGMIGVQIGLPLYPRAQQKEEPPAPPPPPPSPAASAPTPA